MTNISQTDLDHFKTTGEAIGSLENILIEDCLWELELEKRSRENYNLLVHTIERSRGEMINHCFYNIDEDGNRNDYHIITFGTYTPEGFSAREFAALNDSQKLNVLLILLSRTPDGKAVMPFLDIDINDSNHYYQCNYCGYQDKELNQKLDKLYEQLPKTLQTHLLKTATGVCFNQGKGFEAALKATNAEYIRQRYL